ncbi:hypothetical protein EV356DRAFT_498858 [Viridothelium virens]|uniref:Uncharacterized protein n=1 Tax=Viridothelium virens TaxID=1048519 RepID=A0A6A6HD32_VIRVR|nr:hypothetical protein EV356DRAFT_498858 [Viridothelium virens]
MLKILQMSSSAYWTEPSQTIPGHSLDPHKLMNQLEKRYGPSAEGQDNFRVELRRNSYNIYPSQTAKEHKLSQEEIRACEVRRI